MFKSLINIFKNNKHIEAEGNSRKVDLEIKLNISDVIVREPTEDEEEIRELGLKATKNKKTDINFAIECLQKQKKLMEKVSLEYSFQEYLRLPKYLQQAGKMNDAIVECNALLENDSKHQVQYIMP